MEAIQRYNVTETANFLQASQSWVYSNAERLGGVKVGKYWSFTKYALEYFLVYGYAPGRKPEASNEEVVEVCGELGKEVKRIKLTSQSMDDEYASLLGL